MLTYGAKTGVYERTIHLESSLACGCDRAAAAPRERTVGQG
jgi:hypothetical protein